MTTTTRRIVYGIGPIRELVERRSRDIVVLYVDEKRTKRVRDPAPETAKRARSRNVNVEFCSRQALSALSGTDRHQGLVAVVGMYEYADLDDLLHTVRSRADALPLLVALDHIHDPRNLGAIIRSAYVLGANAVIIPRDRAAGVTAVTTKTSAGATEHLPVCQVTNLARALTRLKSANIWIAGIASGTDSRPLHAIDATMPLCLVLGSEGAGLSRVVQKTCDLRFEIPMAARGVGSLNVSVAASIALYEVARRRRPPDGTFEPSPH